MRKSAGENGGADDPLTEVVPVHEPWVPTVQDVRRPANDKHARLLDKDSLLPRNHYDYTSAPLDLTSVPFEEVGELARMSFSNNGHATKFVFCGGGDGSAWHSACRAFGATAGAGMGW